MAQLFEQRKVPIVGTVYPGCFKTFQASHEYRPLYILPAVDSRLPNIQVIATGTCIKMISTQQTFHYPKINKSIQLEHEEAFYGFHTAQEKKTP